MSKKPAGRQPPKRPTSGKGSAGTQSSARRRQATPRQLVGRRTARSHRREPIEVRAALKRVPRAAWVCVAIAFLNAFTWSLITPAFQGRDEVDHFAYTQQLAEKGSLPRPEQAVPTYPFHEGLVLEGLHYWQSRFTSYTPAISSAAEQRELMSVVHTHVPPGSTEEAGGAWYEPPLYYALQTVPYTFGAGNVLLQLQFMRFFSVLLGAITALLAFLFLREILPGVPWAATVGALCVALQPQFAFMSGSVNPDVMLYALTAGIFLCLARAFRRGISRRQMIALGVLVAAGLITYFSFIGVAIGALGALGLLAIREARARNREALVALAIGAAIAISPVVLYGLRNIFTGHPLFGYASGVAGSGGSSSPLNEFSYIWQLYLPRLPGMPHYLVGSTWKDIWFDRAVGLYGWMDTSFPGWVDDLALPAAGAIGVLFVRALVRERAKLKGRLLELGSYVVIVLALMAMVGITSYDTDALKHESMLGEPRYLLPLLPLLGAVVVLAVRGAGRRWMPVAGAAIVILFLGHDLLSQLQAIGRYYG